MGKLFGGSQTSETKIPQYLEDASKSTLGRSEQAASIGHVPYYGPDVAALSPQEYQAMQSTQRGRKAFGMDYIESDPLAQINGMTAPVDPSQYANVDAATAINNAYKTQLGRDPDQQGFEFWMQNYNPETFANDFADGTRIDPLTGLTMPGTTNGVRGYSSAPMFESAKRELQQRAPGQYEALLAPFINPQTGEASQFNQQRQQQQSGIMSMFTPDYGGASDHGYGGAAGGAAGGNAGGGFGGFGGYSGLGDMFDGGGPGQSGSKYGGALGGISNAAGKSPGKSFGGIFG